jgi:predicted nucleotidyltransferase
VGALTLRTGVSTIARVVPCLPSAIASAIREAADRLRARFAERLVEVVLFGSYAWGAADEGSDVDLCIVIEGLTHTERSEAMDITAEVGIERDVLLAPLVWSSEDLRLRLVREQALAEDIQKRGARM